MFDAYFGAQKLYFCGFLYFEGVQGHVCVDVTCMMHILKPKSYVFVNFGFLEM